MFTQNEHATHTAIGFSTVISTPYASKFESLFHSPFFFVTISLLFQKELCIAHMNVYKNTNDSNVYIFFLQYSNLCNLCKSKLSGLFLPDFHIAGTLRHT